MKNMKNKKAQTGLMKRVAVMAALILIAYFLIYTYILKRGGESIERVGFGPLEDAYQDEDADQDGIPNLQDKCCAAACNPQGLSVEQIDDKFMGCVKGKQGPTRCDAATCNPPPSESVVPALPVS